MSTHHNNAQRVIDTATDRLDKLQNNAGLSEEGRQALAAKIYLEAKTQVEQIRGSEKQGSQSVLDSARRSLFGSSVGSSSDAIAYRDAVDRVEAINLERDALKLLDRAHVTGDTTMTTALISAAIERGWSQVAERHVEHRPSTERHLRTLWDHTHNPPDGMMDALNYVMLKPSSLRGKSEGQIADLAAKSSEYAL